MARSRAFQKCIIFSFWTNCFCKHFCYITGFCDKRFNFCKFAIFSADSKSRAQELYSSSFRVACPSPNETVYTIVFIKDGRCYPYFLTEKRGPGH